MHLCLSKCIAANWINLDIVGDGGDLLKSQHVETNVKRLDVAMWVGSVTRDKKSW